MCSNYYCIPACVFAWLWWFLWQNAPLIQKSYMCKLFWKSNSNVKASFLSPYYLELAFQASVTWLLGTGLESPVSAHKLLATVPSLMLASLLNHFADTSLLLSVGMVSWWQGGQQLLRHSGWHRTALRRLKREDLYLVAGQTCIQRSLFSPNKPKPNKRLVAATYTDA